MTRRELIEMLETGETYQIEFKEKFSSFEKIAKEMIAFANSSGGHIIFGIRDNKKIIGVDSEKTIADLVEKTVRDFTEPVIEYKIFYYDLDNKEIVTIEIPESSNKPHRIQDYKPSLDMNTAQVFVRVNDKSVPASKEMIKLLKMRSEDKEPHKYKVGSLERTVFEQFEKNEIITVKMLAECANISNRRASRTLINMLRAGLINIHTKDNGENYFTNNS